MANKLEELGDTAGQLNLAAQVVSDLRIHSEDITQTARPLQLTRLRLAVRLLSWLVRDVLAVAESLKHARDLAMSAEASRSTASDYVVGNRVAEYVARGIQAGDEAMMLEQSRDRALAELPEPKSLTQEQLKQHVSNRLKRMFRSLASQTRERGKSSRSIAHSNTWDTDVQFEIADRIPIRPDETGAFLQELIADMTVAIAAGKKIQGDWGTLALGEHGDLVIKLNAEGQPLSATPENRRGTEFVRNPISGMSQ